MKESFTKIATPDNRFHNGDLETGEPGTIVTAEWLNEVQDHLLNLNDEHKALLREAGININSGDSTQLLKAVKKLIDSDSSFIKKANISSSVNNNSTTDVASAKAVKTAYDKASNNAENRVLKADYYQGYITDINNITHPDGMTVFKGSTALQPIEGIVDGADYNGFQIKDDGQVTQFICTGNAPDGFYLRINDGNEWVVHELLPVQAGIWFWYAGKETPNGYLVCFGQRIKKSSYPRLFKAIGYSYGGTGEYFNVPDFRKDFIRGARDYSSVGTRQSDAIRNITGRLSEMFYSVNQIQAKGAFYQDRTADQMLLGTVSSKYPTGDKIMFDASRIVPTADENRPRNIAQLPIIKY